MNSRKDSYFSLFEIKNILMDLCFTNTLYRPLTDGLEWCGLIVDYCDVHLSF